jgi:hypothetical protein
LTTDHLIKEIRIGLFCSEKCSGSIILKALESLNIDKIKNRLLISGFQSPLERELFHLFLSKEIQVIYCPARSIEKMRILKAWRVPLKEGRLTILSPFKNQHRMTAKLAWERNLFVAEQADEILILHASPGSKTMKLVETILPWGKPMYTLDDPANEPLLRMGLKPFEI